MDGTDKFHAHLAECRRCAEQPMNLCPRGELLIMEAARDIKLPFQDLALSRKPLCG